MSFKVFKNKGKQNAKIHTKNDLKVVSDLLELHEHNEPTTINGNSVNLFTYLAIHLSNASHKQPFHCWEVLTLAISIFTMHNPKSTHYKKDKC